ncbi:MAG: hypothetical protein ACI8VC_002297 [Candidatus Endobugula sp.]|jgi:hypothetical protein
MNLSYHPSNHVLEILKREPETNVQFSIYKYHPQTVLDERTIIEVSSRSIDFSWVKEKISSLRSDEELAFHSVYKKGRNIYHIPMIDLNCPPNELVLAKSKLAKILPHHIFAGLVFYDSGRSLHAYGSTALKNKEWIQFMGRLLLVNHPEEPTVIDTRWIGHRLLGGYSSLRWSSNSGMYLKIPQIIHM